MDIHSLTEKSVQIRGSITQIHTSLEKWIQSYVTIHFCNDPDKANEFLEYVICQHLPFDKSREIFVTIFKNNHRTVFDRYKLETRFINDINEERNIVCHYILDNSVEAIERFTQNNEVIFLKYKNGLSKEVFNDQRMSEFIRKNFAIEKMIKEIHPLYNIPSSDADSSL